MADLIRSLEMALKREATGQAIPWWAKMKSFINRTYGDCRYAGMGVDLWLVLASPALAAPARETQRTKAGGK